jgi:membrane fusion protein (multidrug efflux system)
MDVTSPHEQRAQRHDDTEPVAKTSEKDERRTEAHPREREPEKAKTSWRDTIRHHPWIVAAVALGTVIVGVGGTLWGRNARQYESTDDAFIDARTVTISPQISGAISEVDVTDNQLVKAGTVLVRIDDAIYKAQLDQAKAQVDQAQANVANLDAQLDAQRARIDQAQKQVAQAQAVLDFAQQEYDRYERLAKTGSGTVQQAQQAQSNLLQGRASLAAAQDNATAAQKQLPVLQTQRDAAKGQLEAAQAQQQLAETNLSYTVITAPVDGRITKLTAAKGAYVAPGQALTMFVPLEIWVTANFKETQLTYMRPGQPASLRIDAFPNREFHGHVDSIQAGSGPAFSLLPPENATGNYVKIVQRVPVKLVFDKPPDVELGPGMSVVPTVKVR